MHNQPNKIRNSKISKLLFFEFFNGNDTFDEVEQSETKEISIFFQFDPPRETSKGKHLF